MEDTAKGTEQMRERGGEEKGETQGEIVRERRGGNRQREGKLMRAG